VVAIGAAAGGVGEALHLGIARGDQHVQKAGDVGAVAGDGVFDAAGDAAQGSLVQDVVHGGAGGRGALTPALSQRERVKHHRAAAIFEVADVALDEVEARPLFCGDQRLHFIEVALVAGGEIVQADDALIQLEQGFQQVAADEASHTGDKPGFWVGPQLGLQGLVGGGHAYSLPSAAPRGRMLLTSNSTAPGWPRALMPASPHSTNWWWPTARMMAAYSPRAGAAVRHCKPYSCCASWVSIHGS